MTKKKEARRSRRVRVNIPLTYKLDKNKQPVISIDEDVVQAKTANVSVLGASIISPYVLPPGVRLHIELDRKPFLEKAVGSAEPIRARGKVVGIRSGKSVVRLSIMFDNMDPSDKELIANYVERHLK